MRQLVKVEDAAVYLGISPAMVRRLLREGRLGGEKLRGVWLVSYPPFRSLGRRGPKAPGAFGLPMSTAAGGTGIPKRSEGI